MKRNYIYIILLISFVLGVYYATNTKEDDSISEEKKIDFSSLSQIPKTNNPINSTKFPEPNVSNRYKGYLADDDFINNFPFQVGYATNEWKQTSLNTSKI